MRRRASQSQGRNSLIQPASPANFRMDSNLEEGREGVIKSLSFDEEDDEAEGRVDILGALGRVRDGDPLTDMPRRNGEEGDVP